MAGDYVEEADCTLELNKSPFASMVPEITGNNTGEALLSRLEDCALLIISARKHPSLYTTEKVYHEK